MEFDKFTKILSKKVDEFICIKNEEISKNIECEVSKITNMQSDNSKSFIITTYMKNGKKYKKSSFKTDIINEKVIDSIIKLTKSSDELKYHYGIPDKKEFKIIKRFDQNILNFNFEDGVTKLNELIKETKHDEVILSSADISWGMNKSRLINSNGVDFESKDTNYSMSASVVTKDKNANYYDYITDYKLINKNNNKVSLGNNILKKVLDLKKAIKIEKKDIPKNVEFSKEVLSSLMKYSFLSNFKGKNVEEGQSLFNKDNLNEKIINENLSIINNGRDGKFASTIDGEGTETKKTNLIEKGVLKNYIYDFNTAKNNNVEPTGSGTINGGTSFDRIDIKSNLKNIDNTLIIDSVIGAHTANSLTTDFSVQIDRAYIRDGEDLKPIKGFLLTNKMIDVLKNTCGMNSKLEEKYGFKTKNLVSKISF